MAGLSEQQGGVEALIASPGCAALLGRVLEEAQAQAGRASRHSLDQENLASSPGTRSPYLIWA